MSKTTPKLGTAYPLRIGKTLRNGSRSLLSLKFAHVPNNTQLTQSGCFTRQDDKCSISLSTADGKGVVYTGTRTNKTAVTDYALVFANGAMWLERADDVFPGLRHAFAEGAEVPVAVSDDVRDDPDSWMVEESGSPITPEGNEGEEVRRPAGKGLSAGRTGGKSVATKTVAHKGLPNNNNANDGNPSSSEEDDSDNNSDSDDSDSDSSQEFTSDSSNSDEDYP